ncbi:MAG: carbon storage regulator CsrA [Bdellovibrionales bacterium]|nr:carbon storage regulator CsrA [Bdellovibrionales bacterium]
MLILTRKPGESVYIGDNIKITIVEIKGHQIRVGIDAPREMRIYREEIYNQILEENKQAADSGAASDQGLEGLAAAWSGRKGSGGATSALQGKVKLTSGTGNPEVVIKKKKQ